MYILCATANLSYTRRSKVILLLVSWPQYEELAHYGLDGVGGAFADLHHHHPHHPHHNQRPLQAVHLTAGPYAPHQFSQSAHSGSGDAVKRDKDAIYG